MEYCTIVSLALLFPGLHRIEQQVDISSNEVKVRGQCQQITCQRCRSNLYSSVNLHSPINGHLSLIFFYPTRIFPIPRI